MNILAVDTSTPQVTAGIVRDGETVAEKLHLDARAHNEVLVPLIQQCLTDSGVAATELDAVVVGCGPGPFTGLRVGMATAASFADALGIPCYGICSLDALAGGVGDELVVTDARRREVYFAAYRDGQRVFGPAVAKPADVMELLKEELAAEAADFAPSQARGSLSHIEQITGLEVAAEQVFPTPKAMVEATHFDSAPGPLVPLYLRRPDAVVPKAMR
ncbi:tRNA (adenosine(37)-N6)-threonylcarbamoyltransferase complex dimerization subunit type 1 TsaB [Corynebacterium amycolatum]|uniref:tRNA (adenosine(37)-N6)-threonylcarbamoyltransferase complex dimerization subunit type 1 TsaB n=1 Tax=Corynebacterium amycolatum TaxID=43765 RepID=UPI000C77ECCA|nr:tRNA (adenosine(37)-N6)-threonylcarbamoyltransferase complex dimerization subunit type 1 TsaB [Corynebacterium amycolatum]KAA0881994.1 tRNA (adenosine(37)-N6)-threonylcarbamoyltransferase complex dimerization subunit type 1 TsaB [Corynebacterium amycolatum]MDK7315089.1 tRNA (adenosine(37)-N6)-threonylcarbamoyltransferase complex dimerization subunit type 1 TsaB [Corynebacterium amycolatum]PKZ21938.1 tRNA (adenosine(37)-N6)-threonylcarbamoyltransferase complex dimerization subunit type 1 TsaB 